MQRDALPAMRSPQVRVWLAPVSWGDQLADMVDPPGWRQPLEAVRGPHLWRMLPVQVTQHKHGEVLGSQP